MTQAPFFGSFRGGAGVDNMSCEKGEWIGSFSKMNLQLILLFYIKWDNVSIFSWNDRLKIKTGGWCLAWKVCLSAIMRKNKKILSWRYKVIGI